MKFLKPFCPRCKSLGRISDGHYTCTNDGCKNEWGFD